jgi:hypothetical protein
MARQGKQFTGYDYGVLYLRIKRGILDRYIEHATRPNHPATKYLLARQIKEQNAL